MKTSLRPAVLLAPLASLLLFCGKQDDIKPEPAVSGASGAGAGAGGSSPAGAAGTSAKAGGAGTTTAGAAGTPAAGAGGATTAGAAGTKPHACPTGLPGPELVEVKGPDGTPYCIDATEVTQAHYAQFLKAKGGDLSGQEGKCEGASWAPEMEATETHGLCPKELYDPEKFPERPMVCTTWCRAKGYCAWAGKRLCGRIGGGTITTPDDSGASDPQGEWYNACSQGGKTVYPYGDTFDPTKCASKANDAVKPSPDGNIVAPLGASDPRVVGCHGDGPPFDRIVNMSGNVSEWEDSCFPSPDHPEYRLCRFRGGGTLALDLEKALRCGDSAATTPNVQQVTVGIRCCAD